MNLLILLIGFVSTATGAALAAYAWRRRHLPGALPLMFFAVVAALRTLIEMSLYLTSDIATQWSLVQIGEAVGICAPLFWVWMVVEFSRGRKDTPFWILLVFGLDLALFQALLWSNESHGLIFADQSMKSVGQWVLPSPELGPARKGWILWRGLLALIALALLIRMALSAASLQRGQAGLMALAILPPFATLYSVKFGLTNADFTPVAFVIMALIMTLAVTRYRLFDIMPMARGMLVENMDQGVLVLDRELRVLDINPIAQELLSETTSTAVGDEAPEFIASSTRWDWEAGSRREPRHFEKHLKDETRGSTLTLAFSQIPLLDSRERLLGWLLLIRDVSERRRYVDALEEAHLKLADLDDMKTHFFTNLTHEFRTPLTLTMGPIQDLLDDEASGLSNETRTSLEIALRNNERLLRLVNRLLDLAKLDAGGMRLDTQGGDIERFLANILAQFDSLASQQGVALSLNSTLSNTRTALDAEKIEQVMVNLIANALRFMPNGGSLEIDLSGDHQWLAIDVRDSGPGIPAETLPHLFDRFYQGEEQSGEGSGIGLSLVRELIELHGGSIGVDSTLGKGSCFHLRIPRLEAVESDQPTNAGHAAGSSPLSVTNPTLLDKAQAHEAAGETVILLVEDNADLRLYIRSQLGPQYRLLEAADGVEGLALARESIPDLIISDLMMPEMDGLELCQALKAEQRTDHIPFVMLTARSDVDSRIEGMETGADDYLTKPFVMKELKARIANLLDTRRRLQVRYAEASIGEETRKPADSFLTRLEALIEERLGDPDLQVSELASALAMSPRQLQRKLRAITGETPALRIRRYRLERAAVMLASEGRSATETCYATGFNTPSYFSRCFKDRFGCTPSSYAQKNQ